MTGIGKHRPTRTATARIAALVASATLAAGGSLALVASTPSPAYATDSAPTISGGPEGGHVGQAYTFTFTSSGTPAPGFTVTAGALPPGLSLDSSTGTIAGTPTQGGMYGPITVTASNGIAPDATDTFYFEINGPPTSVTCPAPNAEIGTVYSSIVHADGDPPSAIAITSGSIPTGLSFINTTHYLFEGTPTALGSFSFRLTATNPLGSASTLCTISVHRRLVLLPNSGGPGTAVTAVGFGFPVGAIITVSYATAPSSTTLPPSMRLCQGVVNSAGQFSCPAHIPQAARAGNTGIHKISAHVGTIWVSQNFNLT
jgi:hypothetical protein